jgi:hypothetical protein
MDRNIDWIQGWDASVDYHKAVDFFKFDIDFLKKTLNSLTPVGKVEQYKGCIGRMEQGIDTVRNYLDLPGVQKIYDLMERDLKRTREELSELENQLKKPTN